MAGKLISFILLLPFFLENLAFATIAFKPAQTYTVGPNPSALTIGDFNGDGKLDLAVVNNGDTANNGVSILLGNGDGTFQPASGFAAGKNPSWLAAGDFNADGKDDLAVARYGSYSDPNDTGEVTIYLSNGDGTFHPGAVLTLGRKPSFVVASDFNSDHKLDLAILDSDSTGSGVVITVSLGNGDGTFETPVDYGSDLSCCGLVAGDFNGDGKPDLAVSGAASVHIFLGIGDGTFQTPVAFGASPLLIAVGDFDGDGNLDIISQGLPHGCGAFKVCPGAIAESLGNGDGTFHAPPSGVGISLGSQMSDAGGYGAYHVADLDGDGKIDLAGWAIQSGVGRFLVALTGDGKGSFASPVTFTAGTVPWVAAIADLNGDKGPDLLSLSSSENTVSVLMNVANPEFSISASSPSPSSISPGQSSTAQITLNLQNAFQKPVALTCSIQPAQAGAPTCSLSSSSVIFDSSGEATATLRIDAGSSAAWLNSLQTFNEGTLLLLPVAGLAFLATGVGGSTSRRRRFLVFPIGAVLFVGIILQTACGGGGTSGGPKSTAYTVTITGTSGAAQRSTTVSLMVQ